MSEALILGGTTLSIIGNYKANRDQARMEDANAAFYDEQADYNRAASLREEQVYQIESAGERGEQVAGFAGRGIELEGSALDIVMETDYLIGQEIAAIRTEGAMNERVNRLKAESSRKYAKGLRDPLNNLLQGGARGMQGAGQLLSTPGGQKAATRLDSSRAESSPTRLNNVFSGGNTEYARSAKYGRKSLRYE